MSYYAKNVYSATAGQTDFTAPAYRDQSEIKVYLNGVLTSAWTWFSSSVIRLNSGASAGTSVIVQRETQRSSQLVTFTKGPIYATDLNLDSDQYFQNIQELWDKIQDAILLGYDDKYDFAGKRATNLASPVADTDAVTLEYLEDVYNVTLNAAVAAAEDARDAALTAETNAELAETNAETAETNAELAETNAEAARDKAQLWAEEDEDVEVETGQYSAKHHRLKAEDAQAAAEGAVAGLNMPAIASGDAGKTLQVNTAETGYILSYPFRHNHIINGDFRLAQRVTATITGVNLAAGPVFGSDRFALENILATGVMSYNPFYATLPSGTFGQAALATVTTADATLGTTEAAWMRYRIEGYDLLPLINREVTLSFWTRNSLTGTHYVCLQNSGLDRSIVLPYTINAANTWELKTLTFTMHDLSAGTWDVINGVGVTIGWVLAAGTNYQNATTGSWLTGDYIAGSSVQNFLATNGNTFGLKCVQLEIGPAATLFEHRHMGAELALCQRYYENSYSPGIAPGTGSVNGAVNFIAGGTAAYHSFRFRVDKRANPVAPQVYSGSTGAAGNVRDITAGADVAASIFNNGVTGAAVALTSVNNNRYQYHYSADAEL